MITEDYVSFEVAKLLKEKGFDSDEVGGLGGFYSESCYESGHGITTQSGQEVGIVYDDLTNADLEHDEYLRPTHQMAMKWLREVHNLHVWIGHSAYKVLSWYYEIHGISDGKVKHIGGIQCGSYEEVVEAALKYSLENLI